MKNLGFVARLEEANAGWLRTLTIRNPAPSKSDPLGQRGSISVVRCDGTEASIVTHDWVDEALLDCVLQELRIGDEKPRV